MELENLKSIWKDISKQEEQVSRLDSEEITSLLKGKTQNAFSKIKRNLLFEVGSLLLATIVFLGLIISQHVPSKIPLVISISVVFVLSAVYYIAKYYQLSRINIQADNLKNGLKTLINTLEKFLKMYFIGSMALTPASTLTGFIYGYNLNKQSDDWLSEMDFVIWSVAFITVFLLTLTMYPFMRWYLHKLYGSYVQELKYCLTELEEEG